MKNKMKLYRYLVGSNYDGPFHPYEIFYDIDVFFNSVKNTIESPRRGKYVIAIDTPILNNGVISWRTQMQFTIEKCKIIESKLLYRRSNLPRCYSNDDRIIPQLYQKFIATEYVAFDSSKLGPKFNSEEEKIKYFENFEL